MARLFNELKEKYAQIPNELIEDDSLSDRARFVFCYMASRPDGWNFKNNHLARVLGYSVETLRKYLKELHTAGWVINKGQSVENGEFGGNIYELKATVPEKVVHEKTSHGKNLIHSNTETTTKTEVSKTNTAPLPLPSEILSYLNSKTDSNFKAVTANTKLIKARLDEGHTLQDIKDVIDSKVDEWAGTKLEQYLRPATLFNAEKFNQYIGTIGKKEKSAQNLQAWAERMEGDIIEGEVA